MIFTAASPKKSGAGVMAKSLVDSSCARVTSIESPVPAESGTPARLSWPRHSSENSISEITTFASGSPSGSLYSASNETRPNTEARSSLIPTTVSALVGGELLSLVTLFPDSVKSATSFPSASSSLLPEPGLA